MKPRKPPKIQHPEFLDALRSAPPPADCPWMRVELVGETGSVRVFALAVWRGWVVAAAPVARAHFGHRARDIWRHMASRGAVLSRIG